MSINQATAELREKVRTLTGIIKHYEGVAMVYSSRHGALTERINALTSERDRLDEDFRDGPGKLDTIRAQLAEAERRLRLAKTPMNPSRATRAVESRADKIARAEKMRAELEALQSDLDSMD